MFEEQQCGREGGNSKCQRLAAKLFREIITNMQLIGYNSRRRQEPSLGALESGQGLSRNLESHIGKPTVRSALCYLLQQIPTPSALQIQA